LAVFAAAVPLSAVTYYVSEADGDDGFNGLAPAPSGGGGPFQTIGRAVSLAGPGDEVRIRGGRYNESISVSNSGSAGSPILVAAHGNEEVVVTPDGFSAFYFDDRSWVTLRGIDFEEASGVSAVTVFGGTGIRLEQCAFRDTSGATALYVENSQSITVEDSVFADNGDTGAYFRNSTGTFRRNVLERHRGSHAMVVEGEGTAGFQIVENTFTDNFPLPIRGCSVLFVLNGGDGIVIEGNTVANSEVPAPTGAVPPGDFIAAIAAANTDGLTVRGNAVRDFQYPGTIDFRSANPAYFLPPEAGGLVGYGIQINGSGWDTVRNVLVEDNFVNSVAGNGINLAQADDSRIAGNEVANCGAYGIFLGGIAGDHSLVAGNVIEDNRTYGNGWLHGGTSGISVWQAGRGNIVRRNISYANRQGTAGRTGFDWFSDGHGIISDIDSDGTVIVNNVCYGNEGAGIAITESDDCVIVHNTLVGNGDCPHWDDHPGLVIGSNDADYSARNALVANNLMSDNRAHQFAVFAFESFDHTVHHNLYAPGPLTNGATAASPIRWRSPKSFGAWQSLWAGQFNATGDIDLSPWFRGGPLENLSSWVPGDGSPGRNAGAAAASLADRTLGLIDTDANGAPRNPAAPTIDRKSVV